MFSDEKYMKVINCVNHSYLAILFTEPVGDPFISFLFVEVRIVPLFLQVWIVAAKEVTAVIKLAMMLMLVDHRGVDLGNGVLVGGAGSKGSFVFFIHHRSTENEN